MRAASGKVGTSPFRGRRILRRDKFTGILLDFDLYRSAHASRPSMLSRARYTSPIPPTPSSATISYGPSFAPEVRGTVRGIIASNSRAHQRSYHRVRVKLPEGSVYVSVLPLICMIASFGRGSGGRL